MSDTDCSEGQCGADRSDHRVASASIEQILTGLVLDRESGVIRCCVCDAVIGATDIVLGYAARCVEAAAWDVQRVYCFGCAPATVRSPTLGVTEAIVGGRVGTRSCPTERTHRSCLVEVTLRAYSPPTEG